MVFTSKNKILKGGVKFNIMVWKPEVFDNYTLTEKMLLEAIEDFNSNITVNTISVGKISFDVLKLFIDDNKIYMESVVREEDIDYISSNLIFYLVGYLVINDEKVCKKAVITNVRNKNLKIFVEKS